MPVQDTTPQELNARTWLADTEHMRRDHDLERATPERASALSPFCDADVELTRAKAQARALLFGRSPEPMKLGRFQLLDRLGHGGMGVVYTAYDEKLDRKVAVKILRRGSTTASARARIVREAQAMARLSHVNVVAVHEVGDHEGELFIAMEFVRGQSLDRWLDERRSWREIVAVFRQAGAGLYAAHQAGMVHRDFKPHNVIRREDGVAKVLDFGLARTSASDLEEHVTLEDSLQGTRSGAPGDPQTRWSRLTRTGALLGTPAYMSPEQFSCNAVTAASDQFSFCAALYEGLYGQPPFAGATIEERASAVLHGEVQPRPPGSDVPAWVHQHVLRGLAVAPELRFPSMRALLDALADDPSARRRGWGLTLLGLALLGGTAWGVTWSNSRGVLPCTEFVENLYYLHGEGVWPEEGREQARAGLLGSGVRYAPETWARVEQRLDDYNQRWFAMNIELCEIGQRSGQSSELTDRQLACVFEQHGRIQKLIEQFYEADADVLRNALSAVSDLPRIERCANAEVLMAEELKSIDGSSWVDAYERLPEVNSNLDAVRAMRSVGKFSEALALAQRAATEAEAIGYEPSMAKAWVEHGLSLETVGRFEAAETTLERAYVSALGQSMKSDASLAASALVRVVSAQRGRHDDARRWAMHAEPLARAVISDEARLMYLRARSAAARAEGDPEAAREYLQRGVALQIERDGPEGLELAADLVDLGAMADARGRLDEAHELYERALATSERALGSTHPMLDVALGSLCITARRAGKYAESLGCGERLLALHEEELDPGHPVLALDLGSLGETALAAGRVDEAREYLERALAVLEATAETDSLQRVPHLLALGYVKQVEGQHAEARAHYERALAIAEETLGPDHDHVARCLTYLGRLALDEGELNQASGAFLERARARVEQPAQPALVERTPKNSSLVALALTNKRFSAADDFAERALSLYERSTILEIVQETRLARDVER